jgi:predicted Zn-dependent peptidase
MSVDRSRLPPVGPDAPVRFPRVDRATVAPGIDVWTVARRDVPVLMLAVIVPSGSASDPADRIGLAALTSDLLDEGSGDRDAIAIHEALARMGAHLDLETGYDATVVSLGTLSRFSRDAISLLVDMVFRPRLHADDFERVRALRCHRLAQMRDVPAALAEQAFVRHLFPAHPYGHLPIGSEASLRALTADEVRAFHAARFRPAGTTLVAVGDLDHEALIAAAGDAFADLAADGRVEFAAVPQPPPTGAGRRLVVVDRPGAPQSELRVGHVAVARSTPDYAALVVLNAVLGGQFVSRINLNLREAKGFTYGARSAFDWRRAPGPFLVQTSVQTNATAAAIDEVLKELRDIAGDRPPTARELELAQASLTRGYARNFETAEQIARALVQLAIYDLPASWYDEFVDKVRAVDGGAVSAAARRHLRPDDVLVTVVGDRHETESALAALSFASTSLAEPV